MDERTCPVCGIELETNAVFDGYSDDDKREEEWYGHCPQCGQRYHWTEVYVYKETKNFEVYSEED